MTPLQLLFLLGLAAAWATLMLPLVDRSRRATVHGSAAGFERAMAVLQRDADVVTPAVTTQEAPTRTESPVAGHGGRSSRTHGPLPESDNGGPIARERPTTLRAARRAPSSDEQLARLRQVFLGSLAAVFATGAAAIAWQGPFWTLFVVVTLATGGFVSVLRHRKLEADRAKAVIRSIRRDSRSFVGRDEPHAYETLPPMMEQLADERHFGGLGGPARERVEAR